jgi:subtilisin family serine protease
MTDTPPWLRQREGRYPGVPAWGAATATDPLEEFPLTGMPGIDRDWAFDGADGTGVRVCIVDTGVDESHPRVGPLDRSAAVIVDADGGLHIDETVREDIAGHGTACASIIRSLAPGAAISSMRVLSRGKYGTGQALLEGLSWAIEQNFHVVNLSLSTTVPALEHTLRELADRAYFRRVLLVVSAHNMPIRSLPWTFASVLSVASHNEPDPMTFYYNAGPPVDFYARGVRVNVAWTGGTDRVNTGNSFAAPHMAGICARILSKHPWLTPFQLKTVLMMTANNVEASLGGGAAPIRPPSSIIPLGAGRS